MQKHGFYKVRSFVPKVKIADPRYNCQQIINAMQQAVADKVDVIVFPELCVTGYTCADLFLQEALLTAADEAVKKITEATEDLPIVIAIGSPIRTFGKLYNCGIVISDGAILGIVPKSFLPNYNEFYEKRWFHSGKGIKDQWIGFGERSVPFGTDLLFRHGPALIGVEICEDLWVPCPPSSFMSMAGANIILNLSASDELIGKHDYLVSLIGQQSARCRCGYVYSSAGWGESSTDLVFTGKAIIGVDGEVSGKENKFLCGTFSETKIIDLEKLTKEHQKFNTFNEEPELASEVRIYSALYDTENKDSDEFEIEDIDAFPFIPSNPETLSRRCKEIIDIQSYGLMRRLDAIKCRKAVIGISGGLDSTLALLVTVNAFDKLNIPRKGIIGITMPGFATSSRTKSNAEKLMEQLGISILEIPIGEAVSQHFKDIGQQADRYDVTYENSQARERTQILMDIANKEGGIVIGTGDMSELALGWCTFNGDHMSMYGVNASVPKTLVRHLVEWWAKNTDEKTSEILSDICDTPISPELVPSDGDDIAQKTEDLVGPYELHDFFLYHFLRNSFAPDKIFILASKAFASKYPPEFILKWIKVFFRRFFSQQFKRSSMPDGPKVGSVNLSPRGDWRMPSDASPELWLNSLEEIKL